MVMTAVRRHRQTALSPRHDQTLLAHQPGDPLSADAAAPGAQFGMHTRTAIGLAALLEDLLDLGGQGSFALRTAGGTTTEPSVERTRRDTDQPAKSPDRKGRPLRGDERIPHVPTSRAKKAAARFRISFSCSSRRFSRRKRASSTRLRLLPGQRLGRACRQNLVPQAPKLVGVNAKLLGNRLQRAPAFLAEFDRLRFVLRRETTTLASPASLFPPGSNNPNLPGRPPKRGNVIGSL